MDTSYPGIHWQLSDHQTIKSRSWGLNHMAKQLSAHALAYNWCMFAGSKIVFGVLSYKLSPVILELLELTSHLSLQVKCCVDFDYWIGFAYLLFLSLISLQDFDIHHYCFTSL